MVATLAAVSPAPSSAQEKVAPHERVAAPGAPVFVELAPITVPVIEGSAVTRQVSVVLSLELEGGQSEADLDAKKRALTDAFLQDRYGMFAQRSGAARVADQRTVKARLSRTATRVLGPGVVREILVEQLYEQARPDSGAGAPRR